MLNLQITASRFDEFFEYVLGLFVKDFIVIFEAFLKIFQTNKIDLTLNIKSMYFIFLKFS